MKKRWQSGLAILLVALLLPGSALHASGFGKGRDVAMLSAASLSLTALALLLWQAAKEPASPANPQYLDASDPRRTLSQKLDDLNAPTNTSLRGLGNISSRYAAREMEPGEPLLFHDDLQRQLQEQLAPSFVYGDGWLVGDLQVQTWSQWLDSPNTAMLEIKANNNPFFAKQQGRFLGDEASATIEPVLSLSLANHLHYRLQPSLQWHADENAYADPFNFGWQQHYLMLSLGEMLLEVGRAPVQWGVGRHSSLLFAGNQASLDLIRLRNAQPVLMPGFLAALGPGFIEAFITQLDEQQNPASPYLMATKYSFKPTASLELGVGYTVEYGGDNAPSNNPWLYFGEFVTDATAASNRNFILDVRYRFANLDIEPYAEFLVEDCCDEVVINPRDVQNLVGLYLPSLDAEGKLDLTLEWVRTNQITYRHATFTDGYSFANLPLGHELGPDAMGFYADMRYWLHAQAWLTMAAALEIRGRRGLSLGNANIATLYPYYDVPEVRQRLQVGWDQHLAWWAGLWGSCVAGYEHVTGFNYERGLERDNFLLSLRMQQNF